MDGAPTGLRPSSFSLLPLLHPDTHRRFIFGPLPAIDRHSTLSFGADVIPLFLRRISVFLFSFPLICSRYPMFFSPMLLLSLHFEEMSFSKR